MDEIKLYLSLETKEKRKYLKNFYKKVKDIKLLGEKVDVYNMGLNDDYKFWNELYEVYKLPEEICKRNYIRIGEEYQINLEK